MANLFFTSVTQTNKYPIEWVGLSNISLPDTTGNLSIIIGKYAHSGSFKSGNNYFTEDLIFHSNQKITPQEKIDFIEVNLRVLVKLLSGSSNKVEINFYLKDIKDTSKGKLLFSLIPTIGKFSNLYKKVDLSNQSFDFKNEAVVVIEFSSFSPFTVDVDLATINSFKQEAPVNVSVTLQSLSLNIDTGNLTVISDTFVTLDSQVINISTETPNAIVTGTNDVIATLVGQTINLGLGSISTIAPATWLNFGDGLIKFQNILINTSNTAISKDLSEAWNSSQSFPFNQILINIDTSAVSKDTSVSWENFGENNIEISAIPQQTTPVIPNQIITINASNTFSFNDGTTVSDPWFLTTTLNPNTILIQVSTVSFFNDDFVAVWLSSLSFTPETIQINSINTAFQSQTSNTNIISYDDLDFNFGINFIESPWELWDNHPKYKTVALAANDGSTFTSIVGPPWDNITSLSPTVLTLQAQNQALNNPNHSSTNTTDYDEINLFSPQLSSNDIWMNWDNHPKYEIITLQLTNNATNDTNFVSPNVISYDDINLTDPVLSSNDIWMNWDNHPTYKFFTIELSAEAVGSSAISTNVIIYDDINLADTNLSSPSVWMNWDNHPKYKVINIDASSNSIFTQQDFIDSGNQWFTTTIIAQNIIFINTSANAVVSDSQQSLNEVDYLYDINLTDPFLDVQSSWMKWDNHPQYRPVAIQTSSVAILELSSLETNWLLWNGNNDSSSFLISDFDIVKDIYHFTRLDNTKFGISYSSVSAVARTMTVSISSLDIQLSEDIEIISSQNSDSIDSVYTVKTDTSAYYIVSYMKNNSSIFTPSYTFISALNDGTVAEEDTGIDIASTATSAFSLGFYVGNNIIIEYRKFDNVAALIKIEASTNPIDFVILASSNVTISDEIFSTEQINTSAYIVNFKSDNRSTVIYTSSMSFQPAAASPNVLPGSPVYENNSYVQFFTNGNNLNVAKFNVNINTQAAPVLQGTATLDNNTPFTSSNYIKAVKLDTQAYAILVQTNNKIYAKILTLNNDFLSLSQQGNWITLVNDSSNNKFFATKNGTLDEIIVIYKNIDNALSIKIMKL